MPNKMYCPRCSREFIDETGFCRDCGLSLGDVASIVAGEAKTAPVMKLGPNFALMRTGFGVFILGLVIALGNAALAQVVGFSQVYGTSIFLFTVMAGLALIGAGMVFPRKRYVKGVNPADKERSFKGSVNTARLQEPAGTPIEHPDFRMPVFASAEPASVTENTTRNLS
ncbi:MAG: hypothetical protein ACJ73D_01905 [Pyrinomonadaceae bacterium]